ncbi:MAG: tRNA epoxyqueuosine(34) reductase QueG [Vampirovibrio sp.]|nr:tRNA epoxyqueuosine(34) reductase QueG [Vampirovibrio sp.]
MEIDVFTQTIKNRALSLGFDVVGILAAEPVKQPEFLHTWLDQGYQAGMDWMKNYMDIRLNPASEKLMPGTKSIVCVAMNYYTPDAPNPAPDAVKIAKYARGTDYHRVIKDKLNALLKEIQEMHPGVTGRALTDSAPLPEKPLAVQAGLGWLGKNGTVIHPQKGSFLFLGELLLDIELAYDNTPLPNHCGTCTRCMEACPTNAIVADRVIDANKCIAYWTIEAKGEPIPQNIADNLEGWVFGCDICQDVCPWNLKFAAPTPEEMLKPRPWNIAPTATDLLALDEEGFEERYRKSPLKRAKLQNLQRNVRAAVPNAVSAMDPSDTLGE